MTIHNHEKIDFKNIIYINRDIDINRKRYMESNFSKYNISAIRYSAISSNFDNYSHDWEKVARKNDPSNVFYDDELLSTGEVGCLLSHLEVIRLYGHEDLIICEDDLDISTLEKWNFRLSKFISMLKDDVQILQMVKYNAYVPIHVKKLIIGDEGGGNWGTAAYYIKSSLSKKIVEEYYVDGKWQLSKFKSNWHRNAADAVLYSFDGAYTCTLFALAQNNESTINHFANPSLESAVLIRNYFDNNVFYIEDYFIKE